MLASWRSAGQRAATHHQAWKQRLAALPAEKRAQFERRLSSKIETDKLAAAVRGLKETFAKTPKEIATRAASELALDALVPVIPELVGGSADLTGSNNTKTKGMAVMSSADYGGRFIHYGVREHGMAAAMNGMALHGGIVPYSGTFLVFSDYCRPAIRLAALMGQRVIHVMTHELDWARRGWADTSAGRASRRAARDPEPQRVSPLRHGRDCGVLAACDRIRARSERAGADAPEPAAASPRR